LRRSLEIVIKECPPVGDPLATGPAEEVQLGPSDRLADEDIVVKGDKAMK
jgi:hypothetical protein